MFISFSSDHIIIYTFSSTLHALCLGYVSTEEKVIFLPEKFCRMLDNIIMHHYNESVNIVHLFGSLYCYSISNLYI